jgi:hypothetical protein
VARRQWPSRFQSAPFGWLYWSDKLRNAAEQTTLGIGLPGFRKFKNFLGNNLRRAIARVLEPGALRTPSDKLCAWRV